MVPLDIKTTVKKLNKPKHPDSLESLFIDDNKLIKRNHCKGFLIGYTTRIPPIPSKIMLRLHCLGEHGGPFFLERLGVGSYAAH